MLSILGPASAACDGVSRRNLLQAAGAGLLGMSLPKLLAAEAVGKHAPGASVPKPKAKSVIFLLLFGGPSQLETFDLKPDASSKIRGPFQPVACRAPGLMICEHLPNLAQVSNKFCVVRTMTHNFNDHSGGGHYIQTGKRWHIPIGGGFNATPQDWPSMGSVVEYLQQQVRGQETRAQPAEAVRGSPDPAHTADLPSYAVVPNRLGGIEQQGQYIRPGEYGGWLGRAYNPLTTNIPRRDGNDNPYWRNCTDEELTFEIDGLVSPKEMSSGRLQTRLSLLDQFDAQRRKFDEHRSVREYDRYQERAAVLTTAEKTRRALNIRLEEPKLRERYGRHLYGQATLMARRLVEAGMRFVTVHYDAVDGYSWDSHVHSKDVQNHLLPTFDQALSALLLDLDQRGLLDETLVVAMGEMGRTPQATDQWGRGHWSTLFPAVLAGAGIRGGATYGSSDKDAAYPVDHPVTPEDLAATIYYALGIDPEIRLPDQQGRPVPILDGGNPVLNVFG